MPHPSATKGARAELEIAKLLTEALDRPVRRKLGAGRTDDEGDLEGLDDWTLEVKNYASISAGVNEGLADATKEQANAGSRHGAALIRRPRGRWFVAMTIEQFTDIINALEKK